MASAYSCNYVVDEIQPITFNCSWVFRFTKEHTGIYLYKYIYMLDNLSNNGI